MQQKKVKLSSTENCKKPHKDAKEVTTKNEKSMIDYFLIKKRKWKRKKCKSHRRSVNKKLYYYLVNMDMKKITKEKIENRSHRTKQKINSYKLKETKY